jgi:hypothetical protein
LYAHPDLASEPCNQPSGLSPVEFVLHSEVTIRLGNAPAIMVTGGPFSGFCRRRLLSGTLVIQDITLGPFTNTHKLAMFGVFV